jgi:hypothetical protein
MTIQERLFRDFHTLMGGTPETFKRIQEEERKKQAGKESPTRGKD